jgi:hypothetical protein
MRIKKYNLENEKGLFSYIKTELDSDDYELLMNFIGDLKQQLKEVEASLTSANEKHKFQDFEIIKALKIINNQTFDSPDRGRMLVALINDLENKWSEK